MAAEPEFTPSDARQRVLDVAEELFMRRGYNSITLRDVAAWNTWYASYGNAPDRLAALNAEITAAAQSSGRDPKTLRRSACVLVRTDPTVSVADAAAALGYSSRHFDRLVRAHFGHGPQTVLRRSRFLDIAAVMRGFAVPDADALADLMTRDTVSASRLNPR